MAGGGSHRCSSNSTSRSDASGWGPAPLSDYITRVAVHEAATVRDALQHSSGIPEYTAGPGYLNMLVADPSRAWSPEEVIALAPSDADFEPGENFGYSNTNYMVLGILIEEATDMPYHMVVRERILDPLAMANTFLEYHEDGSGVFGGYHSINGGIEPVDFDFTSIATNAWAGGASVSTGADLHDFFTALFAGEIVSDELVAEMTANPEWGFGIFAPEWTSDTPLLGHDGRIPGSGTFAIHAPETGMTVFTVANGDHLRVSPATGDVAETIGVPGARLEPDG